MYDKYEGIKYVQMLKHYGHYLVNPTLNKILSTTLFVNHILLISFSSSDSVSPYAAAEH